tara:strand:+ start:806 stop:1216 length:411 start_codon:yes stop_codon:yes gene_type:complete
MIKFSKINNKPLFLIERLSNKKTKKRYDLTSEDKFLQVCYLNLKKGDNVEPHLHLKNKKNTKISSEAWIVFSGSVEVTFFDINKSKVYKTILKKGDISILFNGGHTFKSLTNNTKIFEIKNGPYLGPRKEKENFKV